MKQSILTYDFHCYRQNELIPFVISASFGSLDFGRIDPVTSLADIADSENLWLHVDASYGGFFYMVDSIRMKHAGEFKFNQDNVWKVYNLEKS